MKCDDALILCLLGAFPLGCVLDKYDATWKKNTSANGGQQAGASGTSSNGGSGATSTAISSAGGSSNLNTSGAVNPSSGGTGGSLGNHSATGGLGAFGGNDASGLVLVGGTTFANTSGAASTTTGGVVTSFGTGGNPAAGAPGIGGTSGGPRLARAIAAGEAHTCALLMDGTVYCWGNNCEGQLGDGTISQACGTDVPENMPKSPIPVRVQGLSEVTALTCGYKHSCAVAGGGVFCWGYGAEGQLGNGNIGYNHLSSTPVAVTGITNAKAVAAGERFTCALLDDATVSCWGYNGEGELGDGTLVNSRVPVSVVNNINPTVPLAQISSITAGATHACAAQTDGTGWCWGLSSFEQLGQGTNEDAPRAVKTLFTNVAELTAGWINTCARMKDGSMSCVGGGVEGQLGNAANAGSATPVSPQLPLPAEVDSLAVGASYTCAVIRSDKTVMCWGANWAGQLGRDTAELPSNSPTAVQGISSVVSITAKYAHTCVLVGEGTAYCWGLTHHGQLGNGSTDYVTFEPVKVAGF